MTEVRRFALAPVAAPGIGAVVGAIVRPGLGVVSFVVLWIALYPVAWVTYFRGVPGWRYWLAVLAGIAAAVLIRGAVGDRPAPVWFTRVVLLLALVLGFAQTRRADRQPKTEN